MNATPDNTLADPEQRIADLERQLAESKAERDVSKAERDEALQRETATAEVLQVINSSPGNLTPVFEAMLEKAIRLCGGDRGVLWTIEGGRGRLAAARGLPAEFVALLRERGESGTNSPLQRVVQGEWLIEFPDTVEEFSRSGDPHAKGAVEAGVRSAIWVAIVKEGVTVGAFAIGRSVIGTFSDKQIALLQNFAAQAVIAMENARLLDELRQRTDQVAELNRGLEARVAEQVEELGRVGRLKRFLAPQLAELIVSQGNEKILESHRREIVVVFCDLRGYTAFTETAEPEEVLDFLRDYHGALGPLVAQFEGTLDQFSGDGIMVFFNDPVPIPDPAARAVNMAVAMREAAAHADCRLARARSGFRFRCRYRAGLCDARPDRVLRALRLYGDRHGVQCRCPALCRGQGWPNSPQSTHQCRAKGKRRNRTGWRAGPQGPHPTGGGLQRAACR